MKVNTIMRAYIGHLGPRTSYEHIALMMNRQCSELSHKERARFVTMALVQHRRNRLIAGIRWGS